MIVAPSLLSANFGNLDKDLEMINESEAEMLHLDVMDGVFVPNISFGFPVIKAVQKKCTKPLDVHLMIVNPQNYIQQVKDCGAFIMNVHLEACEGNIKQVIADIKAAGMKAGVTIKPKTPVAALEEVIEDVDLVMLMSVEPGFGGQKFMPETLDRLKELRGMMCVHGVEPMVEVDGGVTMDNATDLAMSGAEIVVAGSFVFGSADPKATIAQLHKI